ncbi:MAG: hypothetical protein LBD53_01805, partial [Tannerella sp.]|nr:hypothetical protein [Tannerella sp.]
MFSNENETVVSCESKTTRPIRTIMLAACLLAIYGTPLSAQTPGGVSSNVYSTEIWLKADEVQSTLPGNGANITTWNDKSGNNRNFVRRGSEAVPTLKSPGAYNYQPSLYWDGTNGDRLKTLQYDNFQPSTGRSYYLFAVSKPTNLDNRLYSTTIIKFVPSDGWGTDYGNPGTGLFWTGQNSNAAYGNQRRVRVSYGTSSNTNGQHNTGSDDNNGFNTSDMKEGIISWISPNNGSTGSGDIASIHLNGRKSPYWDGSGSANGGADRRGRGSNWQWHTSNSRVQLGQGGINTFFPYFGEIMEVILLSKNGNSTIDGGDLQKIHSYLAIKYGFTLHDNAGDYVNSSGVPVWNRTANNGYNNIIFGIARDNAMGLYQKQSTSMTGSTFSVFVGNSLASINKNNTTGELLNGEYVMFGYGTADPLVSTYVHPTNQSFVNGTLTAPTGINYRSGLKCKAQLTGTGAITVKLTGGITHAYCLVSKNTSFTPSETAIYPVNPNGVVTIELTNDYKYIDFAGYYDGVGNAPGGITSGLKMWLRADGPLSIVGEQLAITNPKVANYPDANNGTLTGVSSWKDMVRNHTYSYAAAGGTSSTSNHYEPVYQQNNPMTNYHPALRFWGSTSASAYLSNGSGVWTSTFPTNRKHSAFFVVNNDFGDNDWFNIMMFARTYPASDLASESYRGPGYAVHKSGNNVVGRFRTNWETGDNNSSGTQHLYDAGSTAILGYHIYSQGTANNSKIDVKWRFNGKEDTKNNVIQNGTSGLNIPSMIGTGYGHDRSVRGVVSEVIMYDDALSSASLRQIESYLAIKYGITLRPDDTATKRFDYLFSNGTSFWNGHSGTGSWVTYYNRIAAVIRDDDAALNNRQSHSTQTGSLLHMGVAGEKLGTNANPGALENDKEAIVWGDNNTTGVYNITTPGGCGDFSTMFKRIWMVNKVTKDDRPVKMLVGAQDYTGHRLGAATGMSELYNLLKSGYDVYMIVADDPAKLVPNGQYTAVVPMSFVDGEQQCTYTFSDNITYITFACKPNNKGCAGVVEFSGVKTFDWSQWTRANSGTSAKGARNLGNGIEVVGTSVVYTNTNRPSNYPSVTNSPFSGSLYLQRRGGNATGKVEVTIEFNTPVRPEFTVCDLDGWSGCYEKVSVIGQCAGSNVVPTLSYVSSASAAHHRITGNSTTSIKGSYYSPTDKKGQVNVTFQGGVTKIVITY